MVPRLPVELKARQTWEDEARVILVALQHRLGSRDVTLTDMGAEVRLDTELERARDIVERTLGHIDAGWGTVLRIE